MNDNQRGGWNRRDFMGGAALLALALGMPVAAVKLSDLPADEAPTAQQRLLLKEVSQLVIPRTGTAGAGEVGAGDFVILALVHGLEGSRAVLPLGTSGGLVAFRRADGSLDHVRWLESELNHRVGGDWLSAPHSERAASLAALDAEAYAEGRKEHPWRTVKGLILTGYYTSEVGGSQELRFELVPGRYDPQVPVTPDTRAYSSDWTAVDFG